MDTKKTMDELMGDFILGDITLDGKKMKSVVDNALEALDNACKLATDSFKEAIKQAQSNPDRKEEDCMLTADRACRSGNQVARLLDFTYRLHEFSRGKADSRPDMGLTSHEFLKGLPDRLLKDIHKQLQKNSDEADAMEAPSTRTMQ